MAITKCYRFVQTDMASHNGGLTWKIGEWNHVSGKIVCCTNGLHAALTPRDSLRNVYGQRWFVCEARGILVQQDSKFAASEMRLLQEIPNSILQRFALWCAKDGLKYFEDRYPDRPTLRDCMQVVEDYLDGNANDNQLLESRNAALAIAANLEAGSPVARTIMATVAAAFAAAAKYPAAWAGAASAGVFAAHTAAVAIASMHDAGLAITRAHDAIAAIEAAKVADKATAAAHAAAAAAGLAHAAAVAAAHNTASWEPADPYAAARATDPYAPTVAADIYAAQNQKLSEMINQHFANSPAPIRSNGDIAE